MALSFDNGLFRLLKKRAAEERRSFQAVATDLLRRALTQRPEERYELRLQGWQAHEQPGVDLLDRDRQFELMDGR